MIRHRIHRSAPGLIGVAAVALLAGCGGAEPSSDEATPPPILELGSPSVRVVIGLDTLEVFAPTLLAYLEPGGGEGGAASMAVEAARMAQETFRTALPGLEALGVRTRTVAEVPFPLGIAPEVEAAAGPPLTAGGMGYLIVHPRGRIRRLERGAGAEALVCAAAALLEAAPPPGLARGCGAG